MASVTIKKSDGSVLEWNVTEDKADEITHLLFAPEKRQRTSSGGKRGPKPEVAVEGPLLDKALNYRAEGFGTEAIAKALGVPRSTLRGALERFDSQGDTTTNQEDNQS